MATFVRDKHRLTTLRIRIEPSRSATQVVFRAYKGRELLGSVTSDPEAIGIRERLSPAAYRDVEFRLPQEVEATLVPALKAGLPPGEPVWLQIDRSSGLLAVVPWERLLVPLFDWPILRVPNFVVAPPAPEAPVSVAICASSPRAKERFDVAGKVNLLLTALAGCDVPAHAHVFVDHEASNEVARFPGGQLEVVVHPPPVDPRTPRSTSRFHSPWLSWIAKALASQPVDALCFVCPGYFSGARGSLALSPLTASSDDHRRSHFIDHAQLREFMHLVGASTLCLNVPHESVWNLGLRLLAEEMVWDRPGPLLLTDIQHGTGEEELSQAFAFLFGGSGLPPRSPAVSLSCHPSCLTPYENVPGEELELATSDSETEASKLVHSIASELPLGTSSGKLAWRVTGLQGVSEDLQTIAQESPARREGKTDALKFLARVMESEESSEQALGWLSDELSSKGMVKK